MTGPTSLGRSSSSPLSRSLPPPLQCWPVVAGHESFTSYLWSPPLRSSPPRLAENGENSPRTLTHVSSMSRNRDWFSPLELNYLRNNRLGRLASIGGDGSPQNKPVSFTVTEAGDAIEIVGHNLEASAKWRNIERDPRVAFVVDRLGEGTMSTVSGLEIRGRATLIGSQHSPTGVGTARIRIRPSRILAWNLPETPHEG